MILAIDPGTKKCGIAIVNSSLNLITGEVIDNHELLYRIQLYLSEYQIENIVIGSGTNSKDIFGMIQKKFPQMKLNKVIEKDTTQEARRYYFKHHPPTGLLKILPVSLRVPPRPYDDFAALVIGRRFLQSHQEDL